MEQIAPLIRDQLDREQTVRLSPQGVSMLPLLRQEKDSVELSPLPAKLHPYDIVFYQRPNGAYVLHRLVKVGEKHLTFIGDHQFVYEYGVEPEWCIAVVSALYRGKCRFTPRHPLYRLYCRLWHHSRPLRHLFHRGVGKIKRIFQ